MQGRKRNVVKERRWRKIIGSQAASGKSVRTFCRSKDISERLFYRWRRVIEERDREQEQDAGNSSEKKVSANSGGESGFYQVHSPALLAAPIEVTHPRGHVIRVPVVFDQTGLQRILEVLDQDS